MKSFTLALTLFAAAISAAPIASPSVDPNTLINFRIDNDFTGSGAPGQTKANGNVVVIKTAFANSAIAKNGKIIATSAQLTSIVAGVKCSFTNGNGVLVGELNERKTFLDIDGVSGQAKETDITAWTFRCNVV